MSADLRTLLRDEAPRPRQPIDVDSLFARADQRRRRRRATGAATAIALVVAVVAPQLLGEPPAVPVVDEVDEEPTWESTGAFDRGRDEVLQLAPDTDERLHGRVLAELDVATDDIAVAADGAVGMRDERSLRIVLDGQEVARRDVVPAPNATWLGHDAVAFDTEGTFWAINGLSLVGLRRDGTPLDVDGVPQPEPPGRLRLRVTGTDVSVVLLASPEATRVQVVPFVGQDPLAGSQDLDSPVPPPGEALPTGVPYLVDMGVALTSELLLSGTLVGGTEAELDWQDPPSDEPGYSGSLAQSQLVADTDASLVWMSIYDGSFLVVDRADGTAAVALVAGGPHDGLSVSPDGAVHAIEVGAETTTVRTLLTADLEPLGLRGQEPPDEEAEEAVSEPLKCRDPEDGDRVVDDVDLDADGQPDRVTLHQDGLILACLADGRTTAMSFWPLDDDVVARLEPADLGGTDGVAIVGGPGTEGRTEERYLHLMRLVDGELAAVGDPGGANQWAEAEVLGQRHVMAGDDFMVGVVGGEHSMVGCRSSSRADVDFELVGLTLGSAGAGVELRSWAQFVAGLEYVRTDEGLRDEDIRALPDASRDLDLDAVLRDLGASPLCLPAGPEGAPAVAAPTAVCDEDRSWDAVLDLDEDGRVDRVAVAPRSFDYWGHLVVCLADGRREHVAVDAGPRTIEEGGHAVEPVDLAGTPGVSLRTAFGTDDSHGTYELYVLRDEGLVALTPNHLYDDRVVGMPRDRLADLPRLQSSVRTFGCRSSGSGDLVQFVELLIEGADREVEQSDVPTAFAGDNLAVSYVTRTVDADWRGIGDPSPRVELPAIGELVAHPGEILADLGAVWLCRP